QSLNCRLRHYVARLHRRTLLYGKSNHAKSFFEITILQEEPCSSANAQLFSYPYKLLNLFFSTNYFG
ncbi:MAG: hypothetical protein VXZ92_11975, partial [SAR324 cluster bacterium]|nr:hypothetical protein [SAR324 cluster bacterium]